jgi:hypothetical protein
MPLSIAERKHRMPYGAQVAVATELEVAESYVSAVMNGEVRPKTDVTREKLSRVQIALAHKLELPVEEAFPEHEHVTAA